MRTTDKYRIGGYAKPTGRTMAWRKLPHNSGDIVPAWMVPVAPSTLLFLVEFVTRKEPSFADPNVKEEFTFWKVTIGDQTLWISEEVMRPVNKNEVPEEAWEICGLL